MALSALLLLCVLGDPDPRVPVNPIAHFGRYQPLSIVELYEKRMRFDRREPLISVGIMDGQAEVRLGATGPVRLMFDEVDLPKTVYAPADSRFILRRSSGKPGVMRYWVIVGAAPVSSSSTKS